MKGGIQKNITISYPNQNIAFNHSLLGAFMKYTLLFGTNEGVV